MVYVIPFPVVLAEECFYMAPRALDGVRMSASTPINEANAVIDCTMRQDRGTPPSNHW